MVRDPNAQFLISHEQQKKTEEAALLKNALLHNARHKKTVIVLQCGIVPFGADAIPLLSPGTKLCLERECENQHDRWATKVLTLDRQFLGYLPARKNQSVARLMDAGKIITAEVADINDTEFQTALQTFLPCENPQLGMTLRMEIYEKELTEDDK